MNEVWHDVIDLQLWKMTSITDECFEEDGGNRYLNSADVEDLVYEVKRLRKQLEDCKRQIQETADWIRDRGERLHATDLDNFLEWME